MVESNLLPSICSFGAEICGGICLGKQADPELRGHLQGALRPQAIHSSRLGIWDEVDIGEKKSDGLSQPHQC